jgi:imidazolonepropionase-like amidohydrolase
MRPLLCALVAAVVLTPALASAETVAIVGGTVYPMSGPRIANGTVVISDGRITAVGANVAIPAGARRIDAHGKIVTPGFIAAETQLGLEEVSGERSTRDSSARETIAAAFAPWRGFFSESAYLAATREDGFTTIGIAPTGGFVSGQLAFLDLDRGTAHDMLRKGPIAIGVDLGAGSRRSGDADETAGAPNTAGNEIDNGPASRGDAFGKLHALLDDARYYALHTKSYDTGTVRGLAASREALAALVPVVQGSLPLLVAADRVDDIDEVIHFAKDEKIKVIIEGGAEAWKIASRLAAAHVPVLAGAMNNIPTSFDTLNQRHENLALLRRAGVDVVLIGNTGGGDDESTHNVRNLRYEAGNAVASGLPYEDALRALTLAPATVFGVADHVGSLRAGRDANVVVWSGDPFEFSTVAEHVFVRGHEITERSRQDILTERYRRAYSPALP